MADRDRDQTVEQWLRQTPVGGARGDDCLDADTLAAWSEGSLEGPERSSAEAHAANCARCQAMLAVMVRTTPAPVGSGSPIRKWLMMLGPAMAAAAAVALWFAVDQGQRSTPLVVDSFSKEQAKASRAPESAVAASPVPAEQEADRKALGGSLDREVPKDSAAPKMPADARREREERAQSLAAAPTTQVPSTSENERKEPAAAKRADAPLGSDRLRAAAPPASAAPAPPPPPAAPAARDSVEIAAGARPVTVAPPGPAPQQQANQIPNQNQAQAQNQAPARQQAAEPLAERVIVSAEQPSARAAGDSVAAGRAGARGGVAGGFADASTQAVRTNAGTFDVVVPSSSVRWRVVDGRTVQRSTDAGSTWATQYTAENNLTLAAGAAPTSSTCWLVGRGGAVVRTTDGLSWQRLTFPEPADLTAVISTDARTATVTTADGRRFSTADGGRTWTRQ